MALIFRSQGTYKQRQQGQEEDGGNFEKGHRLIREVWAAGESLRLPLSEVWAQMPRSAPPPVPLAKPSHGAAPCAGLHGWHLSWHRCNGRPYKQKDETRTGAKYHGLAHRPDFVTFRNNRPIQRYRHMGNNAAGIWATTAS
jgi:hypothetical protein